MAFHRMESMTKLSLELLVLTETMKRMKTHRLEIVAVGRDFIVDQPLTNHAENVINHVLSWIGFWGITVYPFNW